MEGREKLKPLVWVGSSKRDLVRFPDEVVHAIGLVLMRVQYGDTPPSVKPLRGFGGAGVLEVLEDDDGGTYRAVYTVRFKERVYVLHAFQKKSKHGIATPQSEIDLIKKRLRWAADLHSRFKEQDEEKTSSD
jgi:phage-related protein